MFNDAPLHRKLLHATYPYAMFTPGSGWSFFVCACHHHTPRRLPSTEYPNRRRVVHEHLLDGPDP